MKLINKKNNRFVPFRLDDDFIDPKSGNALANLNYQEMLDKIKNETRRTCLDNYIYGISTKQTSMETGISVQMVRKNIKKTLSELRRIYVLQEKKS